jgi:TonB family protein
VTTLLFAIIALTIVLPTAALGAELSKQTKGSSQSANRSAKQPVYLGVLSGANLKQIFTYFPYPTLPTEYQFSKINGNGMYRLTIDAQGAVAQIQILKRFGHPVVDLTVLKTFVRWRAKPGPTRIVDVGWWFITPDYQFLRRDEGHLPPRH